MTEIWGLIKIENNVKYEVDKEIENNRNSILIYNWEKLGLCFIKNIKGDQI